MKNKLLLIAIAVVFATQMITAQVPQYVPTSGLVGWWSFTGNANDASTNANNGTVNGATLTNDRFGNANSAYNFDGVSNYIQCASNITTIDNVTISGWAKSNSPLGGEFVQIGEDDNIFCNGIGVGKGGTSNVVGLNFWNIYNGNNLLSLVSCVNYYDSGYLLNANSWFNFVITKANNVISYYVNGIFVGSSPVLNANNPLNKIFFGTSGLLPHAQTFYNGNLDDIGIWNRALTQDEITNLYNSNICYQNITVTDTLIINTGILSYNPVTYNNTVTIYPNPTNDKITIDCGTLANVTGYQIKIFNVLGQQVFAGAMNQQQYIVPLNTWGGQGVYFVKIYDASNNILDTKKIILQ